MSRRRTYSGVIDIKKTSLINGLVSYYQFEGSVKDMNNRYNPVSTSGTINYDKGVVKKGLVLNNSNLYMNTNWGITSNFSFSAWINVANWEDNIYGIILSVNGDWNSTGLMCHDKLFCACVNRKFLGLDSTGFVAGGKNSTAELGKWYFLVVTYNRSFIDFYIDGRLSYRTSFSDVPAFTAARTYIGRYDYGTRNLRGMLDSIGVWNRAITASEVEILYNKGKGI